MVNGAVPYVPPLVAADTSATGTDYFSACYTHHVPPADIYVLEAAINDFVLCACLPILNVRADDRETNRDADGRDTITDTEVLTRELLKSGAAVLMFSTWGLDQAYINGAESHAVVAEYYVGVDGS